MYQAQGKQHAKLGTGLIVASNALPYLLIELELRISRGTFIVIGALGTVGLVMIFAALTKYQYRAPWIFFFLAVYSALLITNPPVGTAVALFILFYLAKNRRSFFVQANKP